MLVRILLAALLVMVTISVAFQFQNHRLLRDLLAEVNSRSGAAAAANGPSRSSVPQSPALLLPEPIDPAAGPLVPRADEEPNLFEPTESLADPPESPEPAAEIEADGSDAWREHGPTVLGIIENLLGGRYGTVVERFNPAMADHLDRDRLAAVMDPIRSEHGPLRRIVRHRSVTGGLPEGMSAFHVTAELADGHRLRFTITLDSQQRISGLVMNG